MFVRYGDRMGSTIDDNEAERGKNLTREREREKENMTTIDGENEREKRNNDPTFIQRINVGRINRVTCSIGFPVDPAIDGEMTGEKRTKLPLAVDHHRQ